MELTGLPLLALAALLTAAAVTGTVLLWSRYGRWRLVSRSVGLLLCEALVVATVGLEANRHEQFYPSWQALAGNTGTTSSTTPPPAGRLDSAFGPGRLRLPWQPDGSAAWHLKSAAQVAVPADYPSSRGSFPALLTLGGEPAAADLIRVVADPGRLTTAAALAGLPARLAGDLRVTGHGWVLLAAAPAAVLATELIRADPGRFSALAVVGTPPRGFRPPPGMPVAVAARSRTAIAGVTYLAGSWAAATGWAAGQTALPLAAPEILPTAAVR